MGLLLGGPFSGGGAPPAPSISLRSVGAFYRTDVDGFGNDVALPTRLAGDNLFVVVAGPLSSSAAQAGWVTTHQYTNNRLQVFTRIATADANDAFTIPNDGSGARIAQMAAFQYQGFPTAPPNYLQNVQSGFLTDGAAGGDSSWDYLGMTDPNTYSNTLCLHWALKFRNFLTDTPLGIVDPYPASIANKIDSFSDWLNESSGTRLWFTWGYEFQATDAALPSGSISYSPSESFGVEVLQATRWEFNP